MITASVVQIRSRSFPGPAGCPRWASALRTAVAAVCALVVPAGCSSSAGHREAGFLAWTHSGDSFYEVSWALSDPVQTSTEVNWSREVFESSLRTQDDAQPREFDARSPSSRLALLEPVSYHGPGTAGDFESAAHGDDGLHGRMKAESLFELPPEIANAGSPEVAMAQLGDSVVEPANDEAPAPVSAPAGPGAADDPPTLLGRIAARAHGEAGFMAPAAGMFLTAVLVIPMGCSLGAGLLFPRQRVAPARASPPRWLDMPIRRRPVRLSTT